MLIKYEGLGGCKEENQGNGDEIEITWRWFEEVNRKRRIFEKLEYEKVQWG